MNRGLALFGLLLLKIFCFSQNAVITGKIIDADDKGELPGVNITIIGTSLGAASDNNGIYRISNIKPGIYNIQFSYIGYEKKLVTGIKLNAGETKTLDIQLKTAVATTEEEVVIVGDRPLVDVEKGKSDSRIKSEVIEAAPQRGLDKILNTQPGVINSPSGINIRGGRTYETGFYIDGVSATDPLAGTGFGLDIGSNAIDEIEITTGGAGVEYGNSTAGVVNTKTKSGGDKTAAYILYKRDNFGFNKNWNSVFNQQNAEFNLSGPIPKTAKKLRYSLALKGAFTDEYYHNPANQVVSSLYPGKNTWSPYQNNRWSSLLKLNYDLNNRNHFAFTYLKSITINQDVNMLRIMGNDASYNPGYQFAFQEQMDNANTFTADNNMQILQWSHSTGKRFAVKATASRMYVHLRADANGRGWRPSIINGEFDPNSIITAPVTYFNPDDSVVFTEAASGFYNNGGIATLWHDHMVNQYIANATGSLLSKSTFNRLFFGTEIKYQDLQWIDIDKPWIGAPVVLANGQTTQSYRLGNYSDIWHVKPNQIAFFVSDKIKYKGLIADIGLRYELWALGKFVDDAVEDPRSPIRDEIRENYKDNSFKLLGLRYKMRLLPRISASFPIKENQVLFFNYGHSTVMPHPSYIYAGLDPFYTDRSTLSRIGNPDLNPEVDISYEIGMKSQITNNDALSITTYLKDKYDFITSTSILVPDITGHDVSRTIRINSDYARMRGIEVAYIKRAGKWFYGQISGAYSVATGQSASANEVLKDLLSSGAREDTKEFYLAWDRPFDLKANVVFTKDNDKPFPVIKKLNKVSLYAEMVWRSGKRYTPYIFTGYEPSSGRPVWVVDNNPSDKFSKLSDSWFWIDLNFRKWWVIKKINIAWTIELTNILNNKNTAIVNPVTGHAYRNGEDVPTEWKDPRYTDPRDPRSNNISANDPSRYLEPRHFLTGFSIRF
jgi:outer membrane receptor protein involved in Fe transport